MKITLSPTGEPYGHPFEAALHLERRGQTLIINGQELDFSVIPDGATLPDGAAATGCPYIVGDIERDDDGVLHVTVMLPHASNAPYEARFPQPIIDPADGIVPLPETGWPILAPEAQEETTDDN
ncbi:hypothetical protein [Paracandidimonas soli]|uniref:Uncharacterized protein n=1 Tax=Paracandidimonas soli TaxID=1917182 RepID=A0A4R3UL74_9BURK|nr:hypothetical protein [Paracandidimonas soli]TCU91281.1 hypothetical protein EV686_1213 [Paracandidimonas soli]